MLQSWTILLLQTCSAMFWSYVPKYLCPHTKGRATRKQVRIFFAGDEIRPKFTWTTPDGFHGTSATITVAENKCKIEVVDIIGLATVPDIPENSSVAITLLKSTVFAVWSVNLWLSKHWLKKRNWSMAWITYVTMQFLVTYTSMMWAALETSRDLATTVFLAMPCSLWSSCMGKYWNQKCMKTTSLGRRALHLMLKSVYRQKRIRGFHVFVNQDYLRYSKKTLLKLLFCCLWVLTLSDSRLQTPTR